MLSGNTKPDKPKLNTQTFCLHSQMGLCSFRGKSGDIVILLCLYEGRLITTQNQTDFTVIPLENSKNMDENCLSVIKQSQNPLGLLFCALNILFTDHM